MPNPRSLLVCIVLVGGCARTASPPTVRAPAAQASAPRVPDDEEMEALLARCGFDSKDRTTNSHPGWMKDREACLAVVRGAYARKEASRGMESIIWLPDAETIAWMGCTYEGLGEACRWAAYNALTMYAGLTESGQHAEDWAEAVCRYLDRGCALGDKEACTILASGVDSRGREYPVHCH